MNTDLFKAELDSLPEYKTFVFRDGIAMQCARCGADFEFTETLDNGSTSGCYKRLWYTGADFPKFEPENCPFCHRKIALAFWNDVSSPF